MTDPAILSAEPSAPAPAGASRLRRALAPILLLAMIAIAFALSFTQPSQQALTDSLTTMIHSGVKSREPWALAQAAMAMGLRALLHSTETMVLIGAFLVVEIALAGRPRSWRVVAFAALLQLGVTVLFYATWPLLNIYLPMTLGIGPLLPIDQSQVAAVLGPFAAPVLAICAILIFSFFVYWAHRAQHQIPFWWRFHAVHHSIEDLDSVNCYVHPGDWVIERVFQTLAAVLIGFTFDTVLWLAAFNAIRDRLIHSRAPIHLGPLRPILIDNRHHFIHHTIDFAQSGRNFGTYVSLWDRVFGTYAAPQPGPLPATGLGHKLPPRTLKQFVLARLDDRPR
ncbi:MAG: sterol desaturase family protein [Pseudomonadota bacterium]